VGSRIKTRNKLTTLSNSIPLIGTPVCFTALKATAISSLTEVKIVVCSHSEF
jgi:hypothetical protein